MRSLWTHYISARSRETIIATKLESKFQADTLAQIKQLFPGCHVFKQDAAQLQGIPDILILYYDKWAMLEFKRRTTSTRRPNQDYYVDLFDSWSYAAFIYPENKEAILHELQQALSPRRAARRPQR